MSRVFIFIIIPCYLLICMFAFKLLTVQYHGTRMIFSCIVANKILGNLLKQTRHMDTCLCTYTHTHTYHACCSLTVKTCLKNFPLYSCHTPLFLVKLLYYQLFEHQSLMENSSTPLPTTIPITMNNISNCIIQRCPFFHMLCF